MNPQARPQMIPTTKGIGMADTLVVVDTPAKKMTASIPSLKTAEKQSRKMAQFVVFFPSI